MASHYAFTFALYATKALTGSLHDFMSDPSWQINPLTPEVNLNNVQEFSSQLTTLSWVSCIFVSVLLSYPLRGHAVG
jgi:hypothetical protein